MIWENCDSLIDEGVKNTFSWSNQQDNDPDPIKLEENKTIQLRKFKNPSTNPERQAFIELASRFGELIIESNLEEITRSLLTDDCQFFIFSSTGKQPVLYALQPEDICDLYKEIEIQSRDVRETYVDLEKSTVAQISNVKVSYRDEDSHVDEIVIELFTIRNDRICKYRGSFARMTAAHGNIDPFELQRKDLALAKVKQINYAFAGTPDLDKVASFFSEKTQYKVWTWDSQKNFTFGKYDFANNFRQLEENLRIECIVPYEIYAESEYVIATYVYHLEGISENYLNKKYIWATTCIYAFDENLNITKINQQGELQPESEATIPFEVFPRERMVKILRALNDTAGIKLSLDILYHNIVQTTCQGCKFGSEHLPDVGLYQGLDQAKQLMIDIEKGCSALDWNKIVDVYIDYCGDLGYDVAILVSCNQGVLNYPGYEYNGKFMNTVQILRVYFEKGAVAKNLSFASEIPEPVPSFFDDEEFQGVNIVRKRDIV